MDIFSYLLGKKNSGGGGSSSDYFTNEIGFSGAGSMIKKIPDNIALSNEVTSLRGFFYEWVNLISVPEFDTSNITVFEGAFYGCVSLENVPQFDGSSVTGSSSELLQHMFEECGNLSNESLRNILKFLLTCVNYTGSKRLRFIGLNSTQANYCTTLNEWTTLENQGWTTGY